MNERTEQDPMYVGYLPLPTRHRVFLALLIPALMLALIGTATLIAAGQRDPGPAMWNASEERAWSGTLITTPYPMLIEDDGTTHLIVEMGKRGAHERSTLGPDPRAAEVHGYELRRSGRRIIELAPDADAITITGPPARAHTPNELGPGTVRGEIVDGKCFLGAMKPGDGKAHKSCAILCIQGGLPPMVAVRDDPFDPTPDEILLLLVDGSPTLSPELLELVASPVEIFGTRSRLGTLGTIDASPNDIRPLP